MNAIKTDGRQRLVDAINEVKGKLRQKPGHVGYLGKLRLLARQLARYDMGGKLPQPEEDQHANIPDGLFMEPRTTFEAWSFNEHVRDLRRLPELAPDVSWAQLRGERELEPA